MRFRASAIVAALLATVMTGVAQAQGRGIELGLDAGFDYRTNDPSVFTFNLPVQQFRVGFPVSDKVSVEPMVSVNYLKVESVDALTQASLGVGLLYHFKTDRSQSQVYVRPFGGLNYIDVGTASETQFALGGGIGIKLPAAERFAIRLEANYNHAFETDAFVSSDTIGALIGFSFFTK